MMLFRKSASLFIFLCMSLNCGPDKLPENVTKACTCHSSDDEYTVSKLYLMDIDKQEAKKLCDDIIVANDDYEFSSISIAVDSHSRSLILAGRAYEVHLLESVFSRNTRVFRDRDNDYLLLVRELDRIDAQDAKDICDNIIASTDKFSSISISTSDDLSENSLIICGRPYEIYLLEDLLDDYTARHIASDAFTLPPV